ncbi:hypothetical protein NtRootA1_01100 [Arthrobacter sp. NtRootA1]|nr:hypothetical protein NtRootA1_01100 [Arthrobacter sp. NtRootA1]
MAAPGEVSSHRGERKRIRSSAAGYEHTFRVTRSGQGVLQLLPRLADDWRQTAGPASALACCCMLGTVVRTTAGTAM